MDGGIFDEQELALIRAGASRELLAGLAHRFQAAEQTSLGDDTALPFLGRVLAGSAIDAALVELGDHTPRLVARATERRERRRTLSADPMSGQLDLGRVALASPEVGLWPIVRSIKSKNTPENALLLATLREVARWAGACGETYAGWIGRDLFTRSARLAHELGIALHQAFGDVPLTEVGTAQLLPLVLERIAFRQADPNLYRRPIELARLMLTMVDPRRQLAHDAQTDWVVKAMLGGLNEFGLQHTAYELWVASRLVRYGEDLGFEFDFPHEREAPFASGAKAQSDQRLEIWWQNSTRLVAMPQGRDHEVQREDGTWRPISLRPDLVAILFAGEQKHILCIECKNKVVEAPTSQDLAQAFGYLSHFRGLPSCALVCRGLNGPSRYRRSSTGETAMALAVPVKPESVGGELFDLLAGDGGGS